MIRNYLDEILIVSGCSLVLIYVYQVWPVGTWLIGGIMLILLGVLVGLGGRNDHP